MLLQSDLNVPQTTGWNFVLSLQSGFLITKWLTDRKAAFKSQILADCHSC